MKSNNLVLAIILFALIGVFVLRKTTFKPSTRSFKETLITVDTSAVDKLVLFPTGSNGPSYSLVKNGGSWQADNGTMQVPAKKSEVNSMLSSIVGLKTKQLIANSPDRQADYEVNEEKGKLIEVYSGSQLIDKLVIGRFNFNQETRQSVSYARLADENDIYSIDGFMSMSFAKDFDSFRDKNLCSFSANEVQSIAYTGPKGQHLFEKGSKNNWVTDQGVGIDSMAMASYLSSITKVSGKQFNDSFSPSASSASNLTIRIENASNPTTLDAYQVSDSWIIKSSENDAYFSSDSVGIYRSIFEGFAELF